MVIFISIASPFFKYISKIPKNCLKGGLRINLPWRESTENTQFVNFCNACVVAVVVVTALVVVEYL